MADGCFQRINGGMLQSKQYNEQLVSLVGYLEAYDGQQVTCKCSDGVVVRMVCDENVGYEAIQQGTYMELVGMADSEGTMTVRTPHRYCRRRRLFLSLSLSRSVCGYASNASFDTVPGGPPLRSLKHSCWLTIVSFALPCFLIPARHPPILRCTLHDHYRIIWRWRYMTICSRCCTTQSLPSTLHRHQKQCKDLWCGRETKTGKKKEREREREKETRHVPPLGLPKLATTICRL